MAQLYHARTGKSLPVEAELVVGRSPSCGLRIDRAYVSAHHATVRWAGSSWQIRDLGSRNGTYLNGTLLEPRRTYDLPKGTAIGFGRQSEKWEFRDDSPPAALIIPSRGEPLIIEREVMGIPNDAEPKATLFRDVDGAWKLEDSDGQMVTVEDRGSYQVAGATWRFSFPEVVGPTSVIGQLPTLGTLRLIFSVSRDEEHVELSAEVENRRVELGSRAFNYLLLTLARNRIEDQKQGVADTTSGWTYQDDLVRALHIPATQLNIDIFRIRQHFAKAGLQEFVNIIERRPRTKQIRIGTGQLGVNTL